MNDDQLLRYSRHVLLDEIGVEGQALGDVEDAGGALGALEVAAEPEAMIGDAGDH